jgi:hypothetical protein
VVDFFHACEHLHAVVADPWANREIPASPDVDGTSGRIGKATSRAPMMYDEGKSDRSVVCAGQRTGQEGWSPSGARMRSAVSKDGGNASSAEERGRYGEA